jgi:gamma-glutamyltranspeptidase/glutathione hydrolase
LIGLGLRLASRTDPTALDGKGLHHVAEVSALLRTLSVARSRGYDDKVKAPDALERLFSDAALAELQSTHDELRSEHPLGSTTHISVLDALGEAASLTMSNGEGCGHTLARWGVHINNFLGEEDINPGGFHRWPAGARMTTMMAPTIVLRDGDPVCALGSGGSNRIRSAILQVLLGMLVSGRPLAEAVEAPRLHVEGKRLWFESKGLDADAIECLRRRWPDATEFVQPNMFFGGVHAAAREQGELHGAGDPRRSGAVAHA